MHTDTPLRKKDLDDIYRALCNVHSKWYDIGIELGMDQEALKSISEMKFKDDDNHDCGCLKYMLQYRLKFSKIEFGCELTWNLIVKSLRVKKVDCNNLANEIERHIIDE